MSSAQRESTKQEIILNEVIHAVRNLDKITWHSAGAIKNWRQDLIEDAKYIQQRLNEFISIVKSANLD